MTKHLSKNLVKDILELIDKESDEDVAMLIEAMEFLYYENPEINDALQAAKIILEERRTRARLAN